MPLTPQDLAQAAVIGVGASLLMDGWNLFLKRAFAIPSLDYRLLGRWFLHMPAGTFVHARIAASPARPFEHPIGWLAHYSIGVALALAFLVVAPADWLARPTLLPALLYGIATVAFPKFVLQPGIASAKAPRPGMARLKSCGTHVVFGFGLYLCALALRHAWPAA